MRLPFRALIALALQPHAITLADVAGTWTTKVMTGPKDSVIATQVTTATADRNGWTMTLPGHDAIPLRIAAIGGDSIVTEAGPYPSTRLKGQMVTLYRTVAHYAGDTVTGTFEAHYSGGHVSQGKIEGTRRR